MATLTQTVADGGGGGIPPRELSVPWSRVTCCRSDSIHFYLFSEGPAHGVKSKLHSMDYGRLIRAGRYRRDPHAVAYIVAIADAAAAIDLIRTMSVLENLPSFDRSTP